jgi:hypothetical protein
LQDIYKVHYADPLDRAVELQGAMLLNWSRIPALLNFTNYFSGQWVDGIDPEGNPIHCRFK